LTRQKKPFDLLVELRRGVVYHAQDDTRWITSNHKLAGAGASFVYGVAEYSRRFRCLPFSIFLILIILRKSALNQSIRWRPCAAERRYRDVTQQH